MSLKRASEDGTKKISIVYSANDLKQNARFLIDSNTIELSPNLKNAAVLPHVLFEIHNAGQKENLQTILNEVDTINKDEFVAKVETLEFSSAQKTREAMLRWMDEGKTIENPFFYLHTNFKDHYLFQQLKGHSKSIAKRFDKVLSNRAPYHGTWPHPPLSSEKEILKAILESKAVLQNESDSLKKDQAQKMLDVLFHKIDQLQQEYGSDEDIVHLLENANFARHG